MLKIFIVLCVIWTNQHMAIDSLMPVTYMYSRLVQWWKYLLTVSIAYTHVATSQMIRFLQPIIASMYVELKWSVPNYFPSSYMLTYSCALKSNKTTYTASTIENIACCRERINITGLHPGSTCICTLLAIYNQASIDKGISLTVTTPEKATCTCEIVTISLC